VYVAGITNSRDFPTLNPQQPVLGSLEGYSDAFVTKYSFAGLSGAPDGSGDGAVAGLELVRVDAVTPNPARDAIELRYTLVDPSVVTLETYASDGALVARPVTSEMRSEGEHIEKISVADLPPGAYAVRVVAAGSSRTKRFVIVR
jgi:hypothetical protein